MKNKMYIVYILFFVVIGGLLGYLLIDLDVFSGKNENDNPPVANTTTDKTDNSQIGNIDVTPTTPTTPSKLTIMDENSKTRPYAIMINNYPAAMKVQAGLNDAYAVYEFPIEGSMSRSIAFFKDKNTTRIGTCRSARQYHPYYVYEHDAIYVHWGSNHPGSDAISDLKITHIDANSTGSGKNKPFYRDNPKGLATEHTGYTGIDRLLTYSKSKNHRLTTDTKPPFKYSYENVDLSSMSGAIKADTIELKYGGSYKLKYTYNKNTQRYERSYNGKTHKDYWTGQVFDTKNIIIEYVKVGTVAEYKDAAGTNYLDITVAGSGKGYYITNGYAREITWTKETKKSQTVYKYLDGSEVKINDGNVYVNFFNKSKTVSIK